MFYGSSEGPSTAESLVAKSYKVREYCHYARESYDFELKLPQKS